MPRPGSDRCLPVHQVPGIARPGLHQSQGGSLQGDNGSVPDYREWVREALRALGGVADRVEVYRQVWELHKQELPEGSDEFYQWQHRVDVAAEALRSRGELKAVDRRQDRPWELVADPMRREPRVRREPPPTLEFPE